MPELIAETVDVKQAAADEAALPPGLYEIRFYLDSPVTPGDVKDTRDYLVSQGVDVKQVRQSKSNGLWYLAVKYRKHAPTESVAFLPMAVIPLIGFAFVGLLIGIGVFKIEELANNIGKLMLIGLSGAIVIVALMRKPLAEAAVSRSRY